MAEDFAGSWFNQHSSEMKLKVSANGVLSGTYRTGVGSPNQKEEFPLTGFVTGDQISFVVNFGKYGSMTAWVGQHFFDQESKTGTIYTFWHLSQDVPDPQEKDKLWASVLTGSDRFSRTQPKIEPAFLRVRPSHPEALPTKG
jgi:hypothetical protein